jgi:hypothetical protein
VYHFQIHTTNILCGAHSTSSLSRISQNSTRYVIIYTRSITKLLDDEIDERFWLRCMLGTWLKQVVDELRCTYMRFIVDDVGTS